MSGTGTQPAREVFHFVMIKPTHYCDDGYPIQWIRSATPSNTLACVNALALEAIEQGVLGDKVDLQLHTYDETNTRVPVRKIIKLIQDNGGRGLVAMLGVQSNQMPRTMDMARPMREAGIKVAIGGFHVSGCHAMLKETPPDIQEALDIGCTLFLGEGEEGRLGAFLKDALEDNLKPIYNYMDDLPAIDAAPTPFLPWDHLKRTAGAHSSFDTGRGCPYQCSFCTIINVQGRKSRSRTPDDVERMIRENYDQGINRFLITDDNFARNKNWEAILDRIIKMRSEEDMNLKFFVQLDTLCHRIPRFIEKCKQAGVMRVYIGLENINPDNLLTVKKHQNKITEYRDMIRQWKEIGATVYVGYIIGFPNDTPERIMRDIEIVKKELAVDLLEIMMLTPLPGSEDHKVNVDKGVWMHPDMNRYDLYHWTNEHPRMSREELEAVYWKTWESFFSVEHMERVMRRNAAYGISVGNTMFLLLWFLASSLVEGLHPVESGYFRLKYRADRRSGMPRENPLVFYPKYGAEILWKHSKLFYYIMRLGFIRWKIKRQSREERAAYSDIAIAGQSDDDLDTLDLYNETEGGKAAVDRKRQADARRSAVREAAE